METLASTETVKKSIHHFYGVCERTDDSFWAEPLNAFTNFAFIYVAFVIYRYYRSNIDLRDEWAKDIQILMTLIFCIGFASLLFHTIPNFYTELADVIFIVTFINIYFLSAMFRVAKCSWFQALVGYIAFLGFTHMVVSLFPRAMNDSIGYLTSMVALIMIALHLNIRRRPSARMFLVAAIIGVTSLFFRAIDNEVCEIILVGTHFLWHLLNATLLYILMKQLIRNINRRARMLRHANMNFA